MFKLKLHWQILLAIILAVICGTLTGADTTIFGISFYAIYGFLGTIFLNALKMIVVPLIMASLITGVASLGAEEGLGRLTGKTILFYSVTSLLAILVGLLMVNLFSPGTIGGEPAGERMNLTANEAEVSSVMSKVEGRSGQDMADVFIRLIPQNVIAAAANGQMLGLIFFSILFGFFVNKVEKKAGDVVKSFWVGVFETMMAITMWVMRFAPIGVFGLVAKVVATTGFAAFLPLFNFFITVIVALAFHTFITLPILLRVIGRVSPMKHLNAMFPAMLTAFSTASSSATLPLTMKCVEENAGVSNRVSGFVLPLGATINMDGTALYECVAAMFIAQAYGIELGFTVQFSIVIVALLTSIGVAGIPAASLVAISIILGVVGLPIEAIGMLLVTDRVLDMLRTSVNVFSDSCGAVIIARTEGEKAVLQN